MSRKRQCPPIRLADDGVWDDEEFRKTVTVTTGEGESGWRKVKVRCHCGHAYGGDPSAFSSFHFKSHLEGHRHRAWVARSKYMGKRV